MDNITDYMCSISAIYDTK